MLHRTKTLWNRFFARKQTTRSKSQSATRRRRAFLESLEERSLLATFSGTIGNPLVIDLNAANSSLAITAGATDYTLTLSGDTWTSADIANATGFGTNVLTVTKDVFSTLNIGDSAAVVGVTFGDSAANTYHDDVAVTLDDPAAGSIFFDGQSSLSTAALSVNTIGAISLSGTGNVTTTGNESISLTTAGNISLASGSNIQTASGAIDLSANSTGTAGGSFDGISINGATIGSTSGNISLVGKGGSSGGAGVKLSAAANVGSSTTGTVTVTGVGGAAASNDNMGVFVIGANTKITSGGGNIVVTGTGGGSAASVNNHGVYFQSGGQIAGTGAGTVSVTGTGGTGSTGGNNVGIWSWDPDSGARSASGTLTLIATGGGVGASSGNDGIYFDQLATFTSGADISLTAAPGAGNSVGYRTNNGLLTTVGGGNIVIASDSMAIGGTVSAETRTVTLRPKTTGGTIAINLGAADSAGVLGLTNGEIGFVTAGTLKIGDGNSGAITISADISRSAGVLSLQSGSTVSENSGADITVSGDLAVSAAGAITLDQGNSVGNFAATTTAGSITYVESNAGGALNINTVDGITGVSTSNADINISTIDGSLTISNTTATNDVNAGSGSIMLTAGQTAGTLRNLTFNNNSAISSSSAISLIANDMSIWSSGTGTAIAGASATVTLRGEDASRAIDLGTDTAGTLGLTNAELDRVTAGTIQIGDASSGAITISAAISHGNNLSLTTGAGVTVDQSVTMATDKSLTINSLSTATAISLTGTNSDLTASGSGAISLTSARNVNVVSGALIQTVDGNLTLEGNLAGTNPNNFRGIIINGTVESTGTGQVSVKGKGGDNSGGANYGVQVSGGIVRGGTSGTVTIEGTGGDSTSTSITQTGVTVESGGLVTSLGANVSVVGFAGSAGSIAHGVNIGSSTITAGGSGTVTVQGTSTVTGQSGVFMGSATSLISSSGGNVTVTGSAGVGVEMDSGADITAGGAGTVTVNGTGGLSIYLDEPGTSITSSGGNIILNSVGEIQLQGDADIIGVGSASITITSDNPNTGTGAHGLDMTGLGTTITAASGNITISSTGGPTAINDLRIITDAAITTTAGGNVSIAADTLDILAGGSINAGTAEVTLKPKTAATTIGLGGATGTLLLADAELDRVTASTLHIGDATSGAITVGGIISPLNYSTLSLAKNTTFDMSGGLLLDVTSPSEYEKVQVAGNVSINGSSVLTVHSTYDAVAGDVFTLLEKTTAGTISGTFFGKPEGTTVAVGTFNKKITYVGGTGSNDVQLTGAAGYLTATLASGTLTIADTSPTGVANNLTVKHVGTNLEITDVNEEFTVPAGVGTLSNGNKTLTISFASVSTGLVFNTGSGNDTVTIDHSGSGGDAIPGGALPGNGLITFNGGDPTTNPGDKLVIIGGSQGTVTYNYTNASDGSVVSSAYGTINYVGLEPITNTGTATDIIFNLPAAASTVTLGDDSTSGNGLSLLSGATFEDTTFANPTGSVTINRGNAADTITIDALPDFNGGLTIGSISSPFASAVFAGAVTLGTNKVLTAYATTISVTAAISAASVTLNAANSVTLTGANADITASVGSSAGITQVGVDTALSDGWRTSSIAKPLDIDGDNIYGTAGYYLYASGSSQPVSSPAFATVAPAAGTTLFGPAAHPFYREADDPAFTGVGPVANASSGTLYRGGQAANLEGDFVEITITQAGSFRLGVIMDNHDIAAISPLSLRVRQTVGGSLDSGYFVATDRDLDIDYYFFDIAGAKVGDKFVLSGVNDGGFASNGIYGVTFDKIQGDITINADSDNDGTGTFTQDNTGSLVVTSGGNVTVSAGNGVSISGILNSGTGVMSINSDADANGTGTLTVNAGANVYGATINVRGADVDVAGTATVGRATSSATASTVVSTNIHDPRGIAFDSVGNMYVSINAARITKVSFSSPGVVDTITPNFAVTGVNPDGLVFDAYGNMYVANAGSNTIGKYTFSSPGVLSTTNNSFITIGAGTGPVAVTIDSVGNLYTANLGNGTITKVPFVSPGVYGAPVTFANISGTIAGPQNITVDPSNNLYVVGNGKIVKIDPSANVTTLATSGVGGGFAMAYFQGSLLVGSPANTGLSQFSTSGALLNASYVSGLNNPWGAAPDAYGNLWQINNTGSTVSKITPGPAVTTQLTVRSSVASRAMNLGGAAGAVTGINLTDAELARLVTSASGTVTIGDSSQTGDITFTTATVATTAGAATTVIQSTSGAGKVVLDNGVGSAVSLSGNTGNVTITAGTGGIVEAATNTTVFNDIASAATVSLTSGGAIGTAALPVQISSTNLNTNTSANNSNQFYRATSTIDATGLNAGTGIVELQSGTLTLGGSNRVNDNSKLNVNGGTFAIGTFSETIDTLTLTSGSVTGSTGALTSTNTIQTQSGSVSAILAGTNGLTKSTGGTTTLSGANTYTGATTVGAGGLTVTGSLSDATDVDVASGATYTVGASDTIDGLTGAGSVVLNASLTIGGNSEATPSFTGVISGGNSLTKIGTGLQTLTNTQTFAGSLLVNAGELRLNGALSTTTDVYVQSTGKLSGAGTIKNVLTGLSGGTIAPGTTVPGTLNVDRLNQTAVSMTGGSALNIEITGTSSYDVLNAIGTISLGVVNSRATLNLSTLSGYVPVAGDQYVFLVNDVAEAISNTFVAGAGSTLTAGTNLTEGTVISTNFLGSGLPAVITYQAGTGNDAAILVGNTTVSLSGGVLTIADAIPSGKNDNLFLKKVNVSGTDYLEIHDPVNYPAGAGFIQVDAHTVRVLFSSITSISVNTLAGDDKLTVDLSGGSVPTINYSGGTAGNDSLALTGGTTDTVTHTFANANDGSVSFAGPLVGTVNYVGLEPIADNLNAAYRVFDFTGSNEVITVTDTGGADGMTTIDSTLSESVTFTNPTASLEIKTTTTAGTDVVTITSIDAAYRAATTITSDAGDTVNVNAALSLGSATSTGNFSVAAATLVNLGANISTDQGTSAGSISIGAPVTLTGTVSLDTDSTLADGTIDITGAINGAFGLTLDSGSANSTFSAGVGGTTPLTGLTITAGDFTATSIALANTSALAITNSGTASSITGTISGTGVTLSKAGTGTLTLPVANSYTGNTTINGGVLSIGHANSTGTAGTVVINSTGVFEINDAIHDRTISLNSGGTVRGLGANARENGTITIPAGANVTFATGATSTDTLTLGNGTGDINASAGTAVLNVTGSGAVVLTQDSVMGSAIAGTTKWNINGGKLSINAENQLGVAPSGGVGDYLTLQNSGTLRFTGGVGVTATPTNVNRGITLATGGGRIETTAGTTYWGSPIIGGSVVLGIGLTKIGGSDFVFRNAGSNTLGSFAIDGGRVFFGNAGASTLNAAQLGGATVTIGNGASLIFEHSAADGTVSTPIVMNSGANLASRRSGGSLFLSGVITLPSTGTAIFNVDSVSTGAILMTNAANSRALTGDLTIQVGGSGTVGNVRVNHAFSGATFGLIKTGISGLVLNSTTSSYTGNTTILNGTIFVEANVAPSAPGPLGNSANAILLGEESGANSALLLTNTASTISRAINVRSGSSGTKVIGGNAAVSSTISGAITLNDNVTVRQNSTGTVTISSILADTGGSRSIIKDGTGTVALSGANTYTGKTSIRDGALSVGSLNSVASPTPGLSSNLGVPSSVANGTIDIGTSTTAATLLYTGSGQTTDRVINLAGTTFGATINQSGTGSLVFASNFTATGVGTKSLTLAGSTAGTGSIQGAVVNGSGTTSLNKTGSGVWSLSGATSNYSGTTTVSEGTLLAGSSNALGASSVVLGNTSGQRSARLLISAAVTINRPITVQSGSAGEKVIGSSFAGASTFSGNLTLSDDVVLLASDAASVVTFSGTISDGALVMAVNSRGPGIVELSGTSNAWDRGTFIESGTLRLAGGNDRLPVGTIVTLGNGASSSGVLDLNNRNQTIAGLLEGGGAGLAANSNRVVDGTSDSTVPTLTLTIASGVTNVYGGILGGTGQDGFAVTKSGAGTMVLGGANTYTGATTISQGVLRLGNTSTVSTLALPVTSGLFTWLDATDLNGDGVANNPASGTAVPSWVDKSLNSRTVSNTAGANQPKLTNAVLNGLPVVRFDGNDGLSNTFDYNSVAGGNGQYSIFTVSQALAVPGTTARLITSQATTGTGSNWLLGYYASKEDMAHFDSWRTPDNGDPYVPTTAINRLHFYTAIDNNTNAFVYDGNRLLATVGNAPAPLGLSLGAYQVNNNAGGQPMNGDIGEVLIFNRAVTEDERRQIVNYLNAKWAGKSYVGSLSSSTDVTVASGATFDVNGNSQAIDGLAGLGTVTNTSATNVALTVGANNEVAAIFNGVIQNGGAITSFVKSGSGTQSLTGANTYSGGTSVIAGTLLVNNTIAMSSGTGTGAVTVSGSAVLGGTGAIAGAVTLSGAARLAPGASPETLETGSLLLATGNFFDVEIGGTSIGDGTNGYDQLIVNGDVALTNASLNLLKINAFDVDSNSAQSFMIIKNDGANPVSGVFDDALGINALPEGSPVTFAGGTLYISYSGGDGNDVVLYSQPTVNGTSDPDTLVLRKVAAMSQVEFSLNGAAFVAVTDALPFTFNGLAGTDLLYVDTSNGDPVSTGDVTFAGELLRIQKRTAGAIDTADFIPALAANAGKVTLTGFGDINFTEVTNVDFINLLTVNVQTATLDDVLTLDAGDTTTNGGAVIAPYSITTVNALVVTGANIPVGLRDVTNANIDTVTGGGDGNDTVTINSVTVAHGITNLSIDTDNTTGVESVTVAGAVTVAGGVEIDSQNIVINALVTAVSTVMLDAGTGSISSPAGLDIDAFSLTATATTGISLETTVANITATNTGLGDITIVETDGANLLNVAADNGLVSATSTAGNLNVTTVSASGSVTIIATAGSITDANLATTNVATPTATLTAATGIALDTSVAFLTATTSGAGSILLNEADAVELTDISAANGLITITAGGAIAAVNIESLNDIEANDIAITATTGNITVGVITAGTTAGDVTLLATTGAIIDDANDGLSDVIGDVVTMTAASGVGQSGNSLDTTANTLDVSVTAAGLINLSETDAVTLADIDTANGAITIIAGSAILATDLTSLTDADANDISITATTGDITVGVISAGTMAGDVTLLATTGSTIDNANDGLADVIGDFVTLTAQNGVGQVGMNVSFDTSANTLDVTVTAAGLINLSETDAVSLADIDTANGSITIIAGGAILATDVASLTDVDANDISVTASTGDITVGMISTGTAAGDVTLLATTGSIIDETNDLVADVTGDVVTITAVSGVGQSGNSLDTTANTLDVSVTAAGLINLSETDAVALADIDTANGSIAIIAGAAILATDVASLTDVDANDISLTAATGDITVGVITAGTTAGDVTLLATNGSIIDEANDGLADVIGDVVTLTAASGVGQSGNSLDTTANTLDVSVTAAGLINLNETDAIALVDIDTANGSITIIAGGAILATDVESLTDVDANDISITATTGDITVGVITAGATAGDVTLLATTGSIIDDTNDLAADVTGDVVTLTATSGVGQSGNSLDTTANTLDVSVTSAGLVLLNEANAVTLSAVDTADGPITIIAGSTMTVTSVVSTTNSDANDILLTTIAGNIAVETVNAGTAGDVTLTAAGAITDLNAATLNITADDLLLLTSSGTASAADPLETSVSNLEATGGTGGVFVANSGDLTIGLIGLTVGISAGGNDIVVSTAGGLTVAENVTATGAGNDVVLSSLDAAGLGQNLTVNAVTISSAAGTITLNAGDNATVPTGSLLTAAGNVTINIDVANADAGVAGVLNFAGDIDAPLAIFNGVGDTSGDSFNVRPDQDVGNVLTPIQVFGFAPIANPDGDSLILNITGLGIPTLTLGPGARNGSFSFGSAAANVTYNDIENVTTNPALPYHLVLDMKFAGFQNGAADTIVAQLDAAGANLLLDVNGDNVFTGLDNVIQSLTIIGSTDNDALEINETAGGLPRFIGQAPAVNNVGVGGGTSTGSHLNTAADLTLETLRGANAPWTPPT